MEKADRVMVAALIMTSAGIGMIGAVFLDWVLTRFG